MNELLKGRISDTEGLKEVLELVATFKDVSTAVLEIDSTSVSGRIGVAWGKFITGALTASPEEKGKKALRQMLRLREGKFVFFDLEDELPIVELRQALGIDLLRTISVVPELDPKEANFLWSADEDPEADDSAPTIKPYIAAAEPLEEDWVEPEEPETVEPEVPSFATAAFETHDAEPILPNFEQMFTAVARESNMEHDLPVPDISEADMSAAYEIRRLPPKPGFESTPALDAVFGSAMPEATPPFGDSKLPKAFSRHTSGRFTGIDMSGEPLTQAAAEPWLPATPPSPPKPPQTSAPRRPQPMLQPNVVADPGFIGQQFIDPASNLRPAPAPDSSKIAQAIICLIIFVVSCASTVILGPRAWELITSVLHH